MRNNYLLCFLLFLFACNQKTEREKIIEKIEENPELFTQLIKGLDNVSKASIPRYIPQEEIPTEIINLFPNSSIRQLMMVDLTTDGQYEACVLLDSLNYKKIVIIDSKEKYEETSSWIHSKGESGIKSQQGILAWEIQEENQRQDLKIKYLNPYFRLIRNQVNTSHLSEDTIKNIRQEINYLTKEGSKTVNIFLVQEGQNSNTTKKEKIEQDSFPLLQDISEDSRYLNLME